MRDFIVFEDEGGGRLVKKLARYHQLHAVRVAVVEKGDRHPNLSERRNMVVVANESSRLPSHDGD